MNRDQNIILKYNNLKLNLDVYPAKAGYSAQGNAQAKQVNSWGIPKGK
jgi:hypothetical protein